MLNTRFDGMKAERESSCATEAGGDLLSSNWTDDLKLDEVVSPNSSQISFCFCAIIPNGEACSASTSSMRAS